MTGTSANAADGGGSQEAGGIALYTLGHSNHALAHFLELVARHAIALVVDTRAQPYSRFNPHFNRKRLEESLEARGVSYLWFGDRLSGRPKDPAFYRADGQVLWDKLMRSPQVREGLDRVVEEARRRRLALICAEEDPMRCHRRLLLAPPLVERGVRVLHIRGDGRIEPEDALGGAAAGRQLDLFAAPGGGARG